MANSKSTRITGQPRRRFYHWHLCRFELLEVRQVLTAVTDIQSGLMYPMYDFVPAPVSATPVGYTPAQMQKAYGVDQISFTKNNLNGTTTVYSEANNNLGAGMTIAIVDAFDDPNIMSDANTFSAIFGLPSFNQAGGPTLKVVNQRGGSLLPTPDAGWAGEIALDVEWAHAIAPGANILLVEATNNSGANLNTAVDFARRQPGVVVVSNSYGGSEFVGERSEDAFFTTPAGHPGVSFTVSAGDTGGPAAYPSSSPNVLSIGGTSLHLTSKNVWSSETVWKDTTPTVTGAGGGGQSGIISASINLFTDVETVTLTALEPVPSYQAGLGLKSRGTPDVSYNADVRTGVAELESYGFGGWVAQGGTSAGAPQWAALLAIADQGRALQGKTSLSNVQSIMYKLPASDFHDIISGDNDLFGDGFGLTGNPAKSGYDLASGRGSPIANLVIRDLVAFNGSSTFTSGPVNPVPITVRQFIFIPPPSSSSATPSNSMTFMALGEPMQLPQTSLVQQFAGANDVTTPSHQVDAHTSQTLQICDEMLTTTEPGHSDLAQQQFDSVSHDDLFFHHSHTAADSLENVASATDRFFAQI
jgi:subtilase family serine protease